jgi:hypothetical protein
MCCDNGIDPIAAKDELLFFHDFDNATPKIFSSQVAAEEYATLHLSSVAQTIMSAASLSPKFRRLVLEMALKKFDGETSVLVKDIAIAARDSGYEELDYNRLIDNLEAFYNIEGSNYFPHIYIPAAKNNIDASSEPLVVLYPISWDSTKSAQTGDVHDAFLFVNDGFVFSKKVNENDSRNEHIWVFAMNESVGNNGSVVQKADVTPRIANLKIVDMAVYDHKESWAAGASEVNIIAWIETYNGLDWNDDPYRFACLRSAYDYYGFEIRKFSRDEVDNEDVITINYPLQDVIDAATISPYQSNTLFFSDGSVWSGCAYSYSIFEYDSWPTGTVTGFYYIADGGTNDIIYRSADWHYKMHTLFMARPQSSFSSDNYPSGIPLSDVYAVYELTTDPEIYYNTSSGY